MMQKPPRPTGVAILAILDFIGGALAILAGVAFIALGGSGLLGSFGFGSLLSGFVAVLGGVVLILGLFAIFVGWGLWSGKGWAWTLAIVLYAIGALFSLASLVTGSYTSIVSLVIYALLIWYLWKPHVKAYFGKGTAPAQPASTMQSPPATAP